MGYNGYVIATKRNNKRIDELINIIESGYNNILFYYYGVVTFKEDFYDLENKRVFKKGEKAIFCGGDRMRDINQMFFDTGININPKHFYLRNLFHNFDNNEYLYDFKTTYKYEEGERVIFTPFEINTKLLEEWNKTSKTY